MHIFGFIRAVLGSLYEVVVFCVHVVRDLASAISMSVPVCL